MKQSRYVEVAYAIETTPGISHIFGNSLALTHMVGLYEECGYAVYPTLIPQEIDGVCSFRIKSIRVHASANELLSLEEFFHYRERNPVHVLSWHLIPGSGKNNGQFVWRFPKGQDMNDFDAMILSIHCGDSPNVCLFGTPDDMEHVWEMYRSFDKIPVRTDYTGENISCMVIPRADMDTLRALVAAKGQTKILKTFEYKEVREMFIDQLTINVQNSQEDGFGSW
jgi:hypothetical protein